jgi:hypothetical protein
VGTGEGIRVGWTGESGLEEIPHHWILTAMFEDADDFIARLVAIIRHSIGTVYGNIPLNAANQVHKAS